MKKTTIAAAALALLATGSAQGQSPNSARGPAPTARGLMVAAHGMLATGVTVAGPDIEGRISTKSGRGASFQIGYGLTPRIMVFIGADAANQQTTDDPDDSFGLTRFEVGARYAITSPSRRFAPYVLAFYGGHAMGAESKEGGVRAELTLSGTELGAGAGVLYALTPRLSLDAGLIAARGKFNDVKLTGDVEADDRIDVDPSTSMRIKLGINWYPPIRVPSFGRGSGE